MHLNQPSVTATVIIPAYTMDRWDLLSQAVASVQTQTRLPLELILSIDTGNEDALSISGEGVRALAGLVAGN